MDEEQLLAPYTVDLNILGTCNLRCPFCWGPPHEQGEILDTNQWNSIIDVLASRGTKAIVLTGGEPLLRRDLLDICRHARRQKLRITLSTNGILLPTVGQQILPYIDEIGIPVDGEDEASNNDMRVTLSTLNHFELVIPALELVNSAYPQVELTVRTVVSKKNMHRIINIGALIEKLGIINARWKLYQFAPIGYGADVKDKYWIDKPDFEKVVDEIRTAYPNLRVSTLDHEARGGRYLHILPDGDAMTPSSTHEEIYLGNVLYDLDDVLADLSNKVEFSRNQDHGSKFRTLGA
jgi:MoaA/NifB/PqqE/SkfB family radical SAM enzyme